MRSIFPRPPFFGFTVNYLFFCSVGQVTLLFVGDVAFSGPVKYYVEHGYHIYNDSFNDVAPYIREADISVANLESPFVSKEVYRYKYKGRKEVILDASPNAAPALRLARLPRLHGNISARLVGIQASPIT